MRQTETSYQSPDGRKRSASVERKLNETCALACGEAVGDQFLKYLRSITIEYVQGPGYDPAVLAHLEGARWLVAIIEKRVHDAKENLPHVA